MCGIAGAIGWVNPEIRSAVACMSGAMIHRGPDDEGQWSTGDHRAGATFAFRRLAILDLSREAHQPMIDPVTGNVIVFNGEIYNFREIRRELECAGESFRSSGDTEVLLKAYAKWGTDAVRRLRGMFAFAIWDAQRQVAVLGRDRVGIKPLYFASLQGAGNRNTLVFASELRALMASGLTSRRINPRALSTYMWNGFVAGRESIVRDVQLLPGGTMNEVSADGSVVRSECYWRYPRASSKSSDVEPLQAALESAIDQHLLSDVPLGVFLSGGIDSSAITALATRVSGTKIRTFNIGFDEARFDESRHARSVAAALGTDHTEIHLTLNEFRNSLDDALASIDQPTFDAINTYFVSRAVRQAGLTVALAGTGGDELFGGYRSFREHPKACAVSRWLSIVPEPLLHKIGEAAARWKYGRNGVAPPQNRWAKLGDVLASRGDPLAIHQTGYALFTRDFMRELLCDGVHPETRLGLSWDYVEELERLLGGPNGYLDLHTISLLELSLFIGQRLLRDTDAASMATSLEVRVPLLDHQVIEAAAALDPRRRFHPVGKKQVLRDLALTELDPAIFDRPKSGFELPIEFWCQRELQPELERVFADADLSESVGLNHDAVVRLWKSFKAKAPGIYWSRVWSLFVLLRWCQRHRVTM